MSCLAWLSDHWTHCFGDNPGSALLSNVKIKEGQGHDHTLHIIN